MAKSTGKVTERPKSIKAVKSSKSRRIKQGDYQSLRLQKRIKHPVRLPNVGMLAKAAWQTVWLNKKLFLGLSLVYGLLNLVLVHGLAGGIDVSALKNELNDIFTGNFGALASGFSIFVALIGTAGNSSSATAGVYQFFLTVIMSLAVIWALRQVVANIKLRVRDPFYQGMYPLVPFILVLLVVGLQCLPLIIGSTAFAIVTTNGIAILAVEKILWGLLYALLALLTFYLLSSSLFALYIVALPDMTPVKALRSARTLVRHRRWTVMRKILALPIMLLIVAAIIMVPIIILLTPLAQWTFYILSMLSPVAIHAYMYTLYRELLNE